LYYEEQKVTSELGGTRMTTWLPQAHLLGVKMQKVARCALAYWELLRRRRAELERIMAIRIQNLYRITKSKMLMAYLKVERQTFDAKQYKAAVGLQTAFRARNARRLVRVMFKAQQKFQKDNGAAETIQRSWRCAMARHRVYTMQATLFQIKFAALYRGMKGYDNYQIHHQLLKADATRIKPAHIRLEHLRAALAQAEDKEIETNVQDIMTLVETMVQNDIKLEKEMAQKMTEQADAIAYERKTGRKKFVDEKKLAMDAAVTKEKEAAKLEQEQNEAHQKSLVDQHNHTIAIATSVKDIRTLARYMKQRCVLPSPSENLHPTDVLKTWTPFDDRQIVGRMTLETHNNKGNDFITCQSIDDLVAAIKEVEHFLVEWRSMATSSFQWRAISSRYVQSKGTVPRSIHAMERMNSIAVAVYEQAHLRTYNTQNLRDNLLVVRRHVAKRQKQLDEETQHKIAFSNIQTLQWLKQGYKKAETFFVQKNKEHDRMILGKEEHFICQEDRNGEKMRNYLTSTSYARIALWETFSTLFDSASRRELYVHRNKNDQKKIKELEDNAVIPPSEEDGAIIVEHVTIATKEFQEFTRRAKVPLQSTKKLKHLLHVLDPKSLGRVQFEHACWWFFSGAHAKTEKTLPTHVKSMAHLFVKRKGVLLHRWSTKRRKGEWKWWYLLFDLIV
jgi:hypothetical protein